jgi:hypothetical protein
MQVRRADQTMTVAAVLILVTVAAAIGPLLLVGLPGSFASSGQDVDAAMLWLHGFADAVSHGNWWPRWLFEGNRGFGSPAFLFYPPGAYWLASIVQLAASLDTSDALVASGLLWHVAASAIAYVWLRQQATPQAALMATALFSLHTYNMLVGPLVRFAYAEIAGTCILLLALLAVGSRRVMFWLPLAFAAMILTHLPMAVLAGGTLPAWSFVLAGAGRAGLGCAIRTLMACLLGAGMAGAYLAPALLLLPEIYSEGWETEGLTVWSGHFLLDAMGPSKAPVQFLFMNAGLVIVIMSALALAWSGSKQAPPMRDRSFAAGAILLTGLCLLMTRLSWPIWAVLPVLQRVQFPWRIMPMATAIWAMLIARRLDVLSAAGKRSGERIAIITALSFGVMALWIPYSAVTADLPAFARYNWTRLQIMPRGPRPLPLRNPVEYAPHAAARAGWRADDPGADALLLDRLAQSQAAVPGIKVSMDPAGLLHVQGEVGEASQIVLPQFAFPGWSHTGTPAGATLATDQATGLLRLDLPAGIVDITVLRGSTGAERIGWAVSAVSILFWLLYAVLPGRATDTGPRELQAVSRQQRPAG